MLARCSDGPASDGRAMTSGRLPVSASPRADYPFHALQPNRFQCRLDFQRTVLPPAIDRTKRLSRVSFWQIGAGEFRWICHRKRTVSRIRSGPTGALREAGGQTGTMMKTTISETAPSHAASRRDFLRSTGRWGGAAALVGLLAWVERPRAGRGGICLDLPACGGCPEFSKCDLPDAVETRQRETARADQPSAGTGPSSEPILTQP